jgi:7-cyano-7-deazaguanine synthase
MDKALVVLSGGLDSTTLLYMAVKQLGAENVKAISFNYGQRHWKELRFAGHSCGDFGIPRKLVDISFLKVLFQNSGSSLVTEEDVPEGHYAEDTMKSTVVPNRNMIMASIAAGYAISENIDSLWLGVHAGDHFVYPDCRPRFFNVLNAAICIGNDSFGPIGEVIPGAELQRFVHTPFINISKADIAIEALRLGVPLEGTWSCYKGDTVHCGKCGTCVERLEAINEAIHYHDGYGRHYVDGTAYADTEFWKEAVKTA